MPVFTIAGERFELEPDVIAEALDPVLPEPIREHYVVVGGRRYPPKQVISCSTQLDRADFTTHQARRILRRLGFSTARLGQAEPPDAGPGGEGPHGGRQALVLRPYLGKWIALASPTEVLVAAATPQEVLAWLARHDRRADYGMFRVPASVEEAEGLAPT
jgi:hypothetical protein